MNSPLSQSQLGVYYACQTDNLGKLNYQNPVFFKLPEDIDISRLHRAVCDAMLAHPYLFSHIVVGEDGVPEMVSAEAPSTEDIVQVTEVDDINTPQATFGRTMDIMEEKLYRCEIYVVGSGESGTERRQAYLYLDIHHVLADGFSMAVLCKEIGRAYDGKEPLGEQTDGAAIAAAEEELRADEALMQETREWYAKHFADAAETDSLPIPESKTDIGETEYVYKHYPLPLTHAQVKHLEHRYGVPESVVMQTAFALLLANYTAEDKSSYCTAYFGRSDRRTLMTTTMMVHTLPVFLQTTDSTTIGEALQSIQDQLRETQKRQYYNYQDVAQELGLNNQVMFVYQGSVLAQKRSLALGGVPIAYNDLRRLTPGWRLVAELFQTEDAYSLKLGYSNVDYSDNFMRCFADSFAAIVASMSVAETIKDMVPCTREQTAWLDKCNRAPKHQPDYSRGFVARFREYVVTQPDALFVVAGDTRLTYKQVDELTDKMAQTILECRVESGEFREVESGESKVIRCGKRVVGYTVPRNEQMVIVPISIAKAGMTAMPLDGSYPAERLNYMKEDAAKYEGTDAFILLYTSGTTGMAKGVMLSERNFITFCNYHVSNILLTSQSRYATYAGYGFDAFQHDLWGCIYAGAAMYIISDEIRFDLEGIYQYFLSEHITHTFMTTQMATQLVLNYPSIEGLEYLVTGGEKLLSLDPPQYRLLNAYGPTETTVYVCSHYVDKNEPNIPIGDSNEGTELFIVNKYGCRVPMGATGELIVSGEQVGLGYLNQPERTSEAFVIWNDKRVYRTGDVVRYREDGKIEFIGRKDGQVKIRGFRIELKEVESVIREFHGIKDATVQAFEQEGGGKFIAAYIVSDETIDIQALNRFIAEQKPPYMVPSVTMQIESIPLNQNQKVNKRALPKPELGAMGKDQGLSDVNIPMNVLEQELHSMVASIIKTEDFGITTNLAYVGLTSISGIRLATQIYKRFGIQLNSKELLKGCTIQDIENEILQGLLEKSHETRDEGRESRDESPSALGSRPHIQYPTPLSHSQQGVYFECMKAPTSTLYNIPMRLTLPMSITDEALREGVEKAVRNHSELFVHFETNENGVVQTIDNSQELHVESHEMTEEEAEAYKLSFVRPFNLTKDLLCRFAIVRTERSLYLYCDIHHLVCDGASYDIFIHDICDALDGKPIEQELCSYSEFVSEQQKTDTREAEAFFRSRLSNVEESTELPSDLINPKSRGEIAYASALIAWGDVEKPAKAQGITPAAVMLAAVEYTLARFANTDHVCLTTISNGRSNLRMANTMGMFVNTLALSAKIGEQTIETFLRDTADSFDQTLAHEDYPFARIAADYDLRADIMFAYQIGVISRYEVHGQEVKTETMELNVPKFKIAFYITEVDGQPSVVIEYDNGLYSEAMMHSLAQSVCNVVSLFAKDPSAPLHSVSLLNGEQIAELDAFNDTHVDYDDTQTIVSLFRRQVEQTPSATAVIYRDVHLTYKDVEERTDAIAARILSTLELSGYRDANTDRETVVSILINRSEWMVLASLGALKAGCAYQPLDPSYPAERLNFMMQDADAALLIADEELLDKVDYKGCILLTKDLSEARELRNTECRDKVIRPSNLFVLLYTSGSTGTPKGVMLEHGNIVAFCHWYQHYYDLHTGEKVAAYASFGFDACMMDMFSALTCGAATCIIPEDLRLNLPDLNDYFTKEGITHSFMTTQVGYQFATTFGDNKSLRHLSAGGEKLPAMTPPTEYKFYNCYGPTECSIFTTTYCLTEAEQNIPIGKPLDNLQLFVVDKHGNRLPVGASGELLVNGPQVGRGYLNQPERTAETFVSWQYKRVYRTGDVVRYMPDGNIQFVGRRDGQVKIRGFRIELKEVESVIREYPDINDATVQAFDYQNGGKYIAAYIVSDKHIDIAALNAFIRERKPPYMVPAATMQIDAIPLNQNQKVNRKSLPAPQIQTDARSYVAPTNDTEHLFCDIFATILTLDKVGTTDNFFELGGTSLMVTRVIIEANKSGYHIAYGDVFDHPTPGLLSQFVSGTAPSEALTDPEISDFDYSGINALLQNNHLQSFLQGERQELGNVLLTGATGYLGIHVLHELITQHVPNIVCIVRGKDHHDAERRLRNLLFYYFDNRFDSLFGKTLHVVSGDVTSDFSDQLSTFDFSISTLINCAANVKHFSKGTDIEDVNIGGAQRCVDFCLKTGARLIHVSTTSTGGVWIDDGSTTTPPVLTEQNIYFSQYLGNQYMHSKFIADRLILDAVVHQGLNAKIMRVGNLAARSYDGEFQANFSTNSYMGRLKVFNLLGCCPFEQYDQLTEFSPINDTARAIVLLAATPKECTVFQPYNNHSHLLGDVLRQLSDISTGVRFVESNEFAQALALAQQDPKKAPMLTGMLAYQDLAHGKKAAVTERDNSYTSAVLHRLGFYWTDTSEQYVSRMLHAIAGLGFFDI